MIPPREATARWAALLGVCALLCACRQEAPAPEAPPGMVLVPGGPFQMGTDRGLGFEGPAHEAEVEPFFMDRREVTNRQFSEFVRATGYVTEAEWIGLSLVFDEGGWSPVPGASWRHPEGPGSSLEERSDHPVVHVSLADAGAYAAWAKKRLPSEAEWERAARGGLASSARYPWGDELAPGGRHLANTWQGEFPRSNEPRDGFQKTAPVASYPPNGYGLFDVAGNVWEWTSDQFAYYQADADPTREQVIRGGSWLCNPDYCTGYRVAARQRTDPDSAANHLGFRCARDARPER